MSLGVADRADRRGRRRLADRPADAEAADARWPSRPAGSTSGIPRERLSRRMRTTSSASWPPRSTGCSIASPSALNHQRQFMADASHELRTPVSVVRTAAQVTLAKEVRSAEEYRESLVIVGEQANRLSRLVDAMFLLSRAEAQGVPLRREFLNLDDILAESARALRVLADQRGVTVTTERRRRRSA